MDIDKIWPLALEKLRTVRGGWVTCGNKMNGPKQVENDMVELGVAQNIFVKA